MNAPAPVSLADDALIRLEVAARAAFPDGSIKLSSLRREARRGNLTIWRIANKDMTTLAEIRTMVEKCRVASPPASGCDPHGAGTPPPGSSSTSSTAPDVRSAQDAARMRVERLKNGSANISPASTTSRRDGNVVSIKRP